MVTLPENLKEQELLNEVTVTTLETGEQVMTSQAKIQIRAAEEVETEDADRTSVDMDNSAVSHTGESYRPLHIQKPEIRTSRFCGWR